MYLYIDNNYINASQLLCEMGDCWYSKSGFLKNEAPIWFEKYMNVRGSWKTSLGLFLKHELIYWLHAIFCGWGYFWWVFFLDDFLKLYKSELYQAGERREICVVREHVIQLDFSWIVFSEWKGQVYSLDYKPLNSSIFLPSWSLLLITVCSWIYLVQPLFNI